MEEDLDLEEGVEAGQAFWSFFAPYMMGQYGYPSFYGYPPESGRGDQRRRSKDRRAEETTGTEKIFNMNP